MYSPNQQSIDEALAAAGQHGLHPGVAAPAPPVPSEPPAPIAAPPEPNPLQQELDTAKRELETSKKTNRSIRVNQALTDAASAEGIIDPSLCATLLARYISVNDNGTFQVRSEENTPRLNSDFSPLSIQQFVHSFAEERPYLVASNLRGGAGSKPSERTVYQPAENLADVFGAKSSSIKASALFKRDPAKYHQMKTRAREAGLIDT